MYVDTAKVANVTKSYHQCLGKMIEFFMKTLLQ